MATKLLLLAVCLLPFDFVFAVAPTLPSFPPLSFHPPKPERIVLDNGLVVFLLEDHELPLIHLAMEFPLGTQNDPMDEVGMGAIFGDVMTQGGSLSRSPEEIERLLDKTAAALSFSVGLESASGAMRSRAQDFDQTFAVFADLLLHPQFRKDFLELSKARAVESLRRMNDEPEDVSRREFRRIIYGRTHPYARIASPESIAAIARQDLLKTHELYFKPNHSTIAISGDFTSVEMKKKIQSVLGSWSKGEVPSARVPQVTYQPQRAVYYIQRPINQSQIRIGHTGLERHNPDHFAWEVFNELWGGGATSSLFRTVRTQQGLAYSVGSGFSEPAGKGLIVAISQTRGPQTIAAVQSILSITKEVTAAPFPLQEIKWAKEAIRNRFVENYTSSAQIATQIMNNEYFGFPDDYLDSYTDRIDHVTPEDLGRVGRTYLHPDQSAILVMGDLSTFSKPLSTLGKMQEIKLVDYSQP